MIVNDTTPPGGSKVGLLIAGDSPAAFSPIARAIVHASVAAAKPGTSSFTILCESAASTPSAPLPMIAAWSRADERCVQLTDAVLSQAFTSLVVVAPLRSFNPQAFAALCETVRAAGTNVVAVCRAEEMVDPAITPILAQLDGALCVCTIDRLATIAAGVAAAKVHQLELAATPVAPRAEALAALATEHHARIIATLWSGAPESGLEALLQTVESIRQTGIPAKLLVLRSDSRIVGTAQDRPHHQAYVASLEARGCIVPSATSLKAIPQFLAAAELLVVTADKPTEEVASAVRCALAAEIPVISTAPALLQQFAPAVTAPMAPFTLPAMVRAALVRDGFKRALNDGRSTVATVGQMATRFLAVLDQLPKRSRAVHQPAQSVVPEVPSTTPVHAASGECKLLLCWDSSDDIDDLGAAMDSLAEALRAEGITVDTSGDATVAVEGYQLVHLFGSSAPLQSVRAECQRCGIPVVASPRYRALSAIERRVNAAVEELKAYRAGGMKRSPALCAELPPPSERGVATGFEGVSRVAASGDVESGLLRRDAQSPIDPRTIPVGSDRLPVGDGGQLFRSRAGIQDFILCVGTIDRRNNQLMLLAALESCELPLVFISEGESNDEEYLALCRSFKRAGQTVFFEQLVPELLASAYQAARVHVNVAWAPMPGLATLEAARAGTNTVVSRGGSIADYLGDLTYSCEPSDPEDIYNAVLAAYYAPVRTGLAARAAEFSWKRAAQAALDVYGEVLGRPLQGAVRGVSPLSEAAPLVAESLEEASQHAKQASMSVGRIPTVVAGSAPAGADPALQTKTLCDDGDSLLRRGDNLGGMAKYRAAIQLDPMLGRAHRSCGVAAIQLARFDEAERYFSQALDLDPSDTKALIGIGSVLWERGEREKAFANYIAAAEKNPQDPASILYLVHSAYALDRLNDLEHALRRFLLSDPNNTQIQYCLAGCYYRQGRTSLAQGVIERILHLNPGHEAALELRAHIGKESGAVASKATPAAPSANGELRLSLQSPVAPAAKVDLESRRESIELAKKQKEYDQVITLCERLLEDRAASASDCAFARVLKGEVLACQGEVDPAMELFVQAEHDERWGYRAVAGIGALRAAAGSLNEAIAYFQRAIALNPRCDTAYAGLGVVASLQGNNEDAWQSYEKALEQNPSNIRALYGIIQLGYQLNRLDGTARAIEGFLDEHPADLSILYSYAGCLFAQGDREGAMSQLNKILLFDKQHALALELIQRIQDSGDGAPFGG